MVADLYFYSSESTGMKFVLTYSGPLHSSGRHYQDHKHTIRQHFHPQLKRQWEIEPSLKQILQDGSVTTGVSGIAKRFQRGAFKFVPLVTKHFNLVCFLDIVMLRREEPGQIIKSGGDIDNRIKTLFDCLRVPDLSQVRHLSPTTEEEHFFCLLEDDALITGFQVKTERLLEPPVNDPEVRLTITATVRPTRVDADNIRFLGGFL